MKNKIFAIPFLLTILISSCAKNGASTVASDPSRSTSAIVVTGKWMAGNQTDVLTGPDAKTAASSNSFAMPLNNWEFNPNGTLTMHNGSSSISMSFKLLPNNKIVLSFKNAVDTMEISRSDINKIKLTEIKKLKNGGTLTESLELGQ